MSKPTHNNRDKPKSHSQNKPKIVTINEELAEALAKDFDAIYVKGFTTDWREQRMVRRLELKIMPLDNLSKLFANKTKEARQNELEHVLDVGWKNFKQAYNDLDTKLADLSQAQHTIMAIQERLKELKG